MATVFTPPLSLPVAARRLSWRRRLEQGTALLAAAALLTATAWPEPALASATRLPDAVALLSFVSQGRVAGAMTSDAPRHTPGVAPSSVPVIPGPVRKGSAFRVVATAYSSTPEQTDGDPYITASGARVNAATVAANFLPLGTHIRYQGRIYIVQDRMNSRYDGRAIIDIWHPSTQAARQFGARVIEIEIVSLPGESR